MAASGSAQSRCQEPKSGLKRVRSEAGSAVSSRKRRASGSSACGSSSTPVLSAFHLPQTLDKPSSETSGPNHRKTVKVASRCASSLDTWRQANPVIFSTRLVAAEEDTSCSAGAVLCFSSCIPCLPCGRWQGKCAAEHLRDCPTARSTYDVLRSSHGPHQSWRSGCKLRLLPGSIQQLSELCRHC